MIPDGRIRMNRLLTEEKKQALRAIRLEGLSLLNIDEVEMMPEQRETWIEYWFDKDKITEDELRTQINLTIINSH